MANKGIFITATDTNVGKTYVAAGIASAMQLMIHRNQSSTPVKLWKPVQSGAILGDSYADSYRLVQGSGLPQSEADTVSYTFNQPLAPMMAARREGRTIEVTQLRKRFAQFQETECYLIIEGAGGLMVPLTEQHLLIDVAVAFAYPLVIIARPELGTVNHTLLTIQTARAHGLEVSGVILNGCYAERAREVRENVEMIETFGHTQVIAQLPWSAPEPVISKANAEGEYVAWQAWRQQWTTTILEHISTSWLHNEIDKSS